MEANTNNEEPDADIHQNVIGGDSLLDPQNRQSDSAPIDANNNGLRRSRENTGYFNRPFETPSVTVRDLIFLIIPLLAHAYDVGNDIYLTVEYFKTQDNVYGCSTLAFVVIPAITCAWISSRMYDNRQLEIQGEGRDESRNYLEKIAELNVNCAMVILLQLALPLRYLRSLCYALRVRKCKQRGDNIGLNHYYPKMLKEQEDLALLNVIECFLETAPQLVLQLTILLMENRAITTTMWFKIVGGFVTLFLLGWSMKTYHCAIRLAQPDKSVVNYMGRFLLLSWHYGTIAARIFLMAIAASNWLTYTLMARVLIWIGTTIWLYNEDGVFAFCQNKTISPLIPPTLMDLIRTSLFAAALAVVYIFTFVNLKEGQTCLRYTIYHVWCVLENVTVLVFWVVSQPIENVWFSECLMILSVILYMIGIGAMVTYYFFCHPTLQNRPCMLFTGNVV